MVPHASQWELDSEVCSICSFASAEAQCTVGYGLGILASSYVGHLNHFNSICQNSNIWSSRSSISCGHHGHHGHHGHDGHHGHLTVFIWIWIRCVWMDQLMCDATCGSSGPCEFNYFAESRTRLRMWLVDVASEKESHGKLRRVRSSKPIHTYRISNHLVKHIWTHICHMVEICQVSSGDIRCIIRCHQLEICQILSNSSKICDRPEALEDWGHHGVAGSERGWTHQGRATAPGDDVSRFLQDLNCFLIEKYVILWCFICLRLFRFRIRNYIIIIIL